MANFMKFVVLALIGFGLGAGLAWYQKRETMTVPPAITASADTAGTAGLDAADENIRENVVPDAPAMPTAEGVTAELGDMAETAAAGIEETADAAADMAQEAADDVAAAGAAAMADAQDMAADVQEGAAEAMPEAAQKVAGSSVGGSFTLVDHNGNTVTEKSWPGKKKLVFFGFTYCPDICPAGLEKLTTVLNELGDSASEIQPLFISTDPKRDTPERMKEYLADYHDSFIGLTGTEEQIENVKSAYKVYAAKAEGGDAENYLINHSAYVYLMSEDDTLLQLYGGSDTAESITAKIQKTLESAE